VLLDLSVRTAGDAARLVENETGRAGGPLVDGEDHAVGHSARCAAGPRSRIFG
jgi:hypothetical protein